MGIRQTLNQNPAISAGLMVVLIAAAAAILWYALRTKEYAVPDESFYTVDDGQTLFIDHVDKTTPFDHDGQQAVKAYVYTCDAGKTRFVAYLERMPDGFRRAEPTHSQAAPEKPSDAGSSPGAQASVPGDSARPANAGRFLALVRKPGQKDWIKPGDPRYFPTIAVSCPGGSSGPLDRVFP